jgi:hypothetical protein
VLIDISQTALSAVAAPWSHSRVRAEHLRCALDEIHHDVLRLVKKEEAPALATEP